MDKGSFDFKIEEETASQVEYRPSSPVPSVRSSPCKSPRWSKNYQSRRGRANPHREPFYARDKRRDSPQRRTHHFQKQRPRRGYLARPNRESKESQSAQVSATPTAASVPASNTVPPSAGKPKFVTFNKNSSKCGGCGTLLPTCNFFVLSPCQCCLCPSCTSMIVFKMTGDCKTTLTCSVCEQGVAVFMPIYYQHILTQIFFDLPLWASKHKTGNLQDRNLGKVKEFVTALINKRETTQRDKHDVEVPVVSKVPADPYF